MDEGQEVQVPAAQPKRRRNWREVKAENEAKKVADAPKTETAAQAAGQPNFRQDRVRIQLEENDNIPPGGQYFGINGAGFILRPGVPANVPRGIIDILDAAEMDVPVINVDTLQIDGWRKKLRYPYRLLSA